MSFGRYLIQNIKKHKHLPFFLGTNIYHFCCYILVKKKVYALLFFYLLIEFQSNDFFGGGRGLNPDLTYTMYCSYQLS